MKILYQSLEALFYICFGGLIYFFLEITFRGFSHYSMFLCGGIIFYLISLFNRRFSSLHLVTRMIIAAFIITVVELLFGIIFNIVLHEQVWDYSTHYYHWRGQICLTFSIIWFFLSLPILYIDSFIRKAFLS